MVVTERGWEKGFRGGFGSRNLPLEMLTGERMFGYSISMLATQDLQPSEFSQLAFEERPDDGVDVDNELIGKCRE